MAKMSVEEKREFAKNAINGQKEPILSVLTYDIDILAYMNYHNTCSDDKERRRWVMSGMKNMERESDAPIIDRASDFELWQIGPLMRARDRDYYLSNKHLTFIETEVSRLVNKYKKKTEVKVVEKAVGLSSEEKAEALATKLYGEDIQFQVDEYWTNKGSKFSMKSYLITNNVNSNVANKIAEKLVSTVIEVKEAFEGGDEAAQLVESYSNWKRPDLRKLLAFLQGILQDCVSHGQVIKATRKPRVSKAPKKLQYPISNTSRTILN